MMRIVKKAVVAAAVAGLVVTPAVAQTKTRAGDNSPVFTSGKAKPGVGRSAKGEKLGSEGVLIGILAAGAVTGAIIAIADDKDLSPGT